METNYIVHTSEPQKLIQFNHGHLFTRDKELITKHCPRCFRAIRHSTDKCKCGQLLINKN